MGGSLRGHREPESLQQELWLAPGRDALVDPVVRDADAVQTEEDEEVLGEIEDFVVLFGGKRDEEDVFGLVAVTAFRLRDGE